MVRLFPALLALFALSLGAQQPVQDDTGTVRDIYGRTVQESLLATNLKGAWRLTATDDEILPEIGRTLAGYVLFTGRFMAIELHVMWDDESGKPLEDDFQSGIHEYELDSVGNVITSSLIGAYLDENDQLEYENAGRSWTMVATIAGETLTLAREDGSQLVFQRHSPFLGGPTDVFGRSKKAGETTDIFGRKVPEEDR